MEQLNRCDIGNPLQRRPSLAKSRDEMKQEPPLTGWCRLSDSRRSDPKIEHEPLERALMQRVNGNDP
jgi:hypothetical protein